MILNQITSQKIKIFKLNEKRFSHLRKIVLISYYIKCCLITNYNLSLSLFFVSIIHIKIVCTKQLFFTAFYFFR